MDIEGRSGGEERMCLDMRIQDVFEECWW